MSIFAKEEGLHLPSPPALPFPISDRHASYSCARKVVNTVITHVYLDEPFCPPNFMHMPVVKHSGYDRMATRYNWSVV